MYDTYDLPVRKLGGLLTNGVTISKRNVGSFFSGSEGKMYCLP